MGISLRRWLRNAAGGSRVEEVDCRALFEAAEDYRIRELAFWCCVNLIASALGRCEFRTYRGRQEIREEEYYLWNVSPNMNQNSTVFLHKLVARLYQDNEALVVPPPLARGEAGGAGARRAALYVADSWSEEPPYAWPDRQNRYSGIQVGEVSYANALFEEDVLRLRLNHCDITPVIRGIYDSYVKLISAAMNNYTWTNGQHWKVHVTQLASGSEGWAEQFQKMLTAQIKPFLTSNSAVLPELDGYAYENVDKTVESGRDASHIRALVNDIFDFTANAFLIPPVLLRGQVEGSADAAKRFMTHCVDPLADQLSEEITRKRFGFEGWRRGDSVRVDTSAIQHFSIFENAANVEKLIGSGYSYNDVQRAAGGSEINEPWADQHFLTKNFAKAEDVLNGNVKGEESNETK